MQQRRWLLALLCCTHTAALRLPQRAAAVKALKRQCANAAAAAALFPAALAPAPAHAAAPPAAAPGRVLVEEMSVGGVEYTSSAGGRGSQKYTSSTRRYDLVDKYYYDGDALSNDAWKRARAQYGSAAEQKPGQAAAFRDKTMKALGGDRYTRILDPKTYAAVARFDILGVGLILSPGPDGRAAVVSPPLPGSAAQKSGLVKQGDVVDTLNGAKTAGLSSFELLDVIDRSEDKGRATFGIVPAGASDATPRLVTLPRTVQETADPLGRTLLDETNEIGYVRLKEFNARLGGRLAEALQDLEARGATRFVLDLRGNPGGAFQEAVSAASLFLGDGAPVVTVVERGPSAAADRRETFRAKAPPPARKFGPDHRVQLWVDRGSASASEIFADCIGAMRDNCAAAIAGDTSFGKGKIQAVFGLGDDSGLVVTVAQRVGGVRGEAEGSRLVREETPPRYLTPAGTVIQGVGITPESKLPGPAVPFGPLPLPSAAAFDEAWDARVCPKPQTEARI